MRIAITGGTGFVGRHLARLLTREGHEAVLICRGVDRRDFRADLNVDYAVAVFGGLFTPRALPRLRASQPLDAIAEASVGFFLAGVGSSRIPAPPAAEQP